jgi:hypothetical protein
MKFYNTILAFIILSAGSLASVQAQTIRVANNNPGATAGVNVYVGATALSDAITASVNGDIIHVMPSSVSYGNITIDKSLRIYGIGSNPDKQGSKVSTVDYLYIADAGDNSTISGLNVNYYLYFGNAGNQTINGVLIENCYIAAIYAYTNSVQVSNTTIHSNIIGKSNFSTYRIYFYNNTSNIIITNNIFVVGLYYPMIYGAYNGTIISNNLFIGNNDLANDWAFYDVETCTIKNNIFYGLNVTASSQALNNTFMNNISFGVGVTTTFPVGSNGNKGSGNLEAVDPKLVNVPYGVDWSYSYNPNLQAGSPAINAGDDGTNLGVTGSAVPFNFTGTNLPLVQSVNTPAVIIQGNNLPTNVKAKGN